MAYRRPCPDARPHPTSFYKCKHLCRLICLSAIAQLAAAGMVGLPCRSMSSHNLFDAIPENLPHEITESLLARQGIRIERIVSKGHASPAGFWYDQPEDEWVLLLAGRAGLQFEDEAGIRELGPGDYVHIPARRRHRVAWTDTEALTVWLAIFF